MPVRRLYVGKRFDTGTIRFYSDGNVLANATLDREAPPLKGKARRKAMKDWNRSGNSTRQHDRHDWAIRGVKFDLQLDGYLQGYRPFTSKHG